MHSKLSLIFLVLCLAVSVHQSTGQSISSPTDILSELFYLPYNIVNNVILQPAQVSPIGLIFFYCANYQNKTFQQTTFLDPKLSEKVNVTNPFVFILHGWQEKYDAPWMLNMGALWVQYHEVNVCLVDWSLLAASDYFTVSKINIYIVGLYINSFIQYLNLAIQLEWADVKCVGLGLGAHTCGNLGLTSTGKLGAIYGLDPSGPWFGFPYVACNDRRLDATDAGQVLVIHTSAPIYGYAYNCGHEDFYPNYGTVPQPGCIYPFSQESDSPDVVICSHYRAADIMSQALIPTNECKAVNCWFTTFWTFRFACTNTIWLSADTPNDAGTYFFSTAPGPECTGRSWLLL